MVIYKIVDQDRENRGGIKGEHVGTWHNQKECAKDLRIPNAYTIPHYLVGN